MNFYSLNSVCCEPRSSPAHPHEMFAAKNGKRLRTWPLHQTGSDSKNMESAPAGELRGYTNIIEREILTQKVIIYMIIHIVNTTADIVLNG